MYRKGGVTGGGVKRKKSAKKATWALAWREAVVKKRAARKERQAEKKKKKNAKAEKTEKEKRGKHAQNRVDKRREKEAAQNKKEEDLRAELEAMRSQLSKQQRQIESLLSASEENMEERQLSD